MLQPGPGRGREEPFRYQRVELALNILSRLRPAPLRQCFEGESRAMKSLAERIDQRREILDGQSRALGRIGQPLVILSLRARQIGVAHEGPVSQQQGQLVLEGLAAGERAGQQFDLAQAGQPRHVRLQRLALGQIVQPAHAGPGFVACSIGRVEQSHEDTIFVIQYCGIGRHAQCRRA